MILVIMPYYLDDFPMIKKPPGGDFGPEGDKWGILKKLGTPKGTGWHRCEPDAIL